MLALLAAAALGAPAPLAAPPPQAADALRPPIVQRPIPFGTARRRETAAYARRHYGLDTFRLRDPHVIVEHLTVNGSIDATYDTFAPDRPDAELHELPGTCAHFVIDTDGTIYQLVNLHVRCRHAIGMNWTAFGIEHVGTNAREILNNGRMMRASLRLTAWLMLRYGVNVGNVIGHAEILESPYHHERVASWRCSTHADWNHSEMRIYRRRLKHLARQLGVPVGAGPRWVDPRC
jgi:N-acetylmuramoyl-L-alanine amidase